MNCKGARECGRTVTHECAEHTERVRKSLFINGLRIGTRLALFGSA